VGVRDHHGVAAPPAPDLASRALGEGDQLVCGRHQDVELVVVRTPIGVVRVAQVVDREDQRTPRDAQRLDDGLQLGGRTRVEPEVHVEDVELVGVVSDPSRLEHRRRPPLRLLGRAAGRHRIGQPLDGVAARQVVSGRRQVPHVHVRRGDGRHAQRPRGGGPGITGDGVQHGASSVDDGRATFCTRRGSTPMGKHSINARPRA
jgi:hypothetical protein